ncbi:MAG: hypothetical protein ACI920_003653 [Saprospiraceae bacterium]|jgi:hypothetical protein
MQNIKFTIVLLLLSFVQISSNFAQSVDQIFLFGNMWQLETNDPLWENLKTTVSATEGRKTIIFTGDFLDENGLEKVPTQTELAKLDKLLELGQTANQVFFLPGDCEWNNTKTGGLDKLIRLDNLIKEKVGKDILLSDNGCPGPKDVDISENLVMMSINSPWLVHPFSDRPDEEDVECNLLNETAFWSEIEDVLKDAEGKNVIIAAHHPIYSFGQFAGYKLTKQHFLPPVIGSFVAGYHQNVGTTKDLAHAGFDLYSQRILKLMTRYPSVVFVSGHEYDLQGHFKGSGYHLNSGAIGKTTPTSSSKSTFYNDRHQGFIKLKYSPNGAVEMDVFKISKDATIQSVFNKKMFQSACQPATQNIPVNEEFQPCNAEKTVFGKANAIPKSANVAAGATYKRKGLGAFIFGNNYRDTWATEIADVPYLPLDTLYGGLKPVGKGGGGQTYNLKLKSADGRKFSFRSIAKDPTKRKDKALTDGVYGKIIQDMVSTQHPYGPLVATELMNQADIPNSQPILYLMPDTPELGVYREEFANVLGFLEIKPQGKKKSNQPFKSADRVETTLGMIQDLIEDNDHSVNAKTYAKARLFDIWVGDWDRHHDNWKWLGYDINDERRVYEAFPKDRDKVFGVLDGIYSFMDWEIAGKELAQFRKSMRGLKSLNNKAKNLDRLFVTPLTREDWVAIADDFQKIMSDAVIEKSIKALPMEDQQVSGPKLVEILKKRRDQLLKTANKYYFMLAKDIDLFGSRKDEIFEINRLKNGDVQVRKLKMKKNGSSGELLFERTFLKKETDEIRIYGLGGDDKFELKGDVNKSILVRIMPGKDEDIIVDQSKVGGFGKKTKVYANGENDKIEYGSETQNVTLTEPVFFKSEHLFAYDYHLILPSFSYNADDGFGFGVTANWTKQGFNKPGYGSNYSLNLSGTTEKSYDIGLNANYRHVIFKWDMQVKLSATNRDRSFRNFYGFGNRTVLNDELRDNDYYENIMESVFASVGFSRNFPHDNQRSSFAIAAAYERRNLKAEGDIDNNIYEMLDSGEGRGVASLPGIKTGLNLDFRDSGTFPTKGTQFKINNFSFLNSEENNDFGGRVNADASIFLTAHRMKTPLTLSLKVGGIHAYGSTPFYYRAFLGQQQNHRGFLRNRFGGETAAYLNSELRLHLGTIQTSIVPLYVGILGLYDVGRVWAEADENTVVDTDIWHNTVGAGFYVIPYSQSFNMNFTMVHSEEEDLLFSFSIGFFVK